MAWALAARSSCPRAAVGVVVTTWDGFVLSTGYNGSPSGTAHCSEVGCLMDDDHCVRSVHAEMNAIITAGRHGVSLQGSTVYVTIRPCIRCLIALVQAGVAKVVFDDEYLGARGDLADRSGMLSQIELIQRGTR